MRGVSPLPSSVAEVLARVRTIPADPDAVDRLIAQVWIRRIAGGDEAPEFEEWDGPGPDPDRHRAWRDNRRKRLEYMGGW